ncbi:MAG: enoyl-CoA hydratase-related protein [Bdellovibrionota bacterium]
MTGTESVSLGFQDRIATIEIRREPQLNALNEGVLRGILAAVREIATGCSGENAYERCRLVVLRGAGEKAFVAGADIKAMHSADAASLTSFVKLGQEVMRSLENLPLPVLAVVQGFAIGGGLELALACDLILAGQLARFGQAEVKLGLIPGFGGTQRLVARVGMGAAKRLVLTGDDIVAEEAFRIGLVDYLVPNDELPSLLTRVSSSLLARSPIALAAGKRAVQGFYNQNLDSGLQREVNEFLFSAQSADAREGMQAFLEKRKATFRGKYG